MLECFDASQPVCIASAGRLQEQLGLTLSAIECPTGWKCATQRQAGLGGHEGLAQLAAAELGEQVGVAVK